jgi:hypothetical protein
MAPDAEPRKEAIAVESPHLNASAATAAPTAAPLAELLARIDSLSGANRERRDVELDRQILRLRHLAGIKALEEAPSSPPFATPAFDALPDPMPVLVEIEPAALNPGTLRAAILRRGCLLVRGLIERGVALELADAIERAFQARDEEAITPGAYEEFVPEPPYEFTGRWWIKAAGGVLAVDSPPAMFDVFDELDRVGLLDLVHAYLGERGLISVEKTTLRRAEPELPGNWHQDGSFLGEVRALNLWLSLSRCGDEAPGLDIIPRRLEGVLPAGGEGTDFPIQIAEDAVQAAAAETGVLRPIFEPGDALLFDEVFLHKTGSDPDMPKPRYALESWFFGGSTFASEYAPVAV